MLIDLTAALSLINETAATAIVVIAASLLLYNLTRNLRDRVARTSAVVLGCMTAAYLSDVFLSLGPSLSTYLSMLRLQWIGIAFMPVALLHLSDALLATTGLPSRGRRRNVIRALYLLSASFLLLAAFSNLLIRPIPLPLPPGSDNSAFASVIAGPLFPVYVVYFLLAALLAFINVQRARKRCITRATRRRMGYLQIALLTPAIGIFPFSILLGPGQEYTLSGLSLVIAANLGVILMLLFLAYPLSFFGSRIPDRIVKVELLRFMLRGPATGLLALVAILYTTPATRILGLPGLSFTPFAVIVVVLLWQWFIDLALPWLERRLVYSSEDDEELETLESLSDRLLSQTDFLQLQEAILSAVCDYLRVNTAFIGAFRSSQPFDQPTPGGRGSGAEARLQLVSAIGLARPSEAVLELSAAPLVQAFTDSPQSQVEGDAAAGLKIVTWQGYWLTPLYSHRIHSDILPDSRFKLPIGVLAVQARAEQVNFSDDDREMLHSFADRAAQSLDDLALQREITAALQGLLPQIRLTRENTNAIEYRPARLPAQAARPGRALSDADTTAFREQVKAALRQYWGGPGLTSSRLFELQIVQAALAEHDQDPANALRSVLASAVQQMRPSGERSYTDPEWTFYNILHERFMRGVPVREVAQRLAFSESHLFRRQKDAIDALADLLLLLENDASRSPRTPSQGES